MVRVADIGRRRSPARICAGLLTQQIALDTDGDGERIAWPAGPGFKAWAAGGRWGARMAFLGPAAYQGRDTVVLPDARLARLFEAFAACTVGLPRWR